MRILGCAEFSCYAGWSFKDRKSRRGGLTARQGDVYGCYMWESILQFCKKAFRFSICTTNAKSANIHTLCQPTSATMQLFYAKNATTTKLTLER